MSYRLKKEENAFQVLREGKFEYRHFEHGKTYDEVPQEDAHRFDETKNEEGSKQKAESRKEKR